MDETKKSNYGLQHTRFSGRYRFPTQRTGFTYHRIGDITTKFELPDDYTCDTLNDAERTFCITHELEIAEEDLGSTLSIKGYESLEKLQGEMLDKARNYSLQHRPDYVINLTKDEFHQFITDVASPNAIFKTSPDLSEEEDEDILYVYMGYKLKFNVHDE